MAIDTSDKRASIIGFQLPWHGPLPRPDGTIGASGRGDLVGAYAGSWVAFWEGVGSSSGVATPAGVGAALWLSDGVSTGVATPLGVGTALWLSTGTSAGVATVLGVSDVLAVARLYLYRTIAVRRGRR